MALAQGQTITVGSGRQSGFITYHGINPATGKPVYYYYSSNGNNPVALNGASIDEVLAQAQKRGISPENLQSPEISALSGGLSSMNYGGASLTGLTSNAPQTAAPAPTSSNRQITNETLGTPNTSASSGGLTPVEQAYADQNKMSASSTSNPNWSPTGTPSTSSTSLIAQAAGVPSNYGGSSQGTMTSNTTTVGGTGAGTTLTPSASLVAAAALYPELKDQINKGGESARKDLTDGSNSAIDSLLQQYTSANEDLAPYANAGKLALNQASDLLGLNGSTAQSAVIDQIKASPSYQFRLQQGQNALDNKLGALGQTTGGAFARAVSDYNQGAATQELDSQYARLTQMAQTGLTATQQQSQQKAKLGDQLGAVKETLGQNQANNTLATTNSLLTAAGANAQNLTNILGGTPAGAKLNTANLSPAAKNTLTSTLGGLFKF